MIASQKLKLGVGKQEMVQDILVFFFFVTNLIALDDLLTYVMLCSKNAKHK